MVIFFVYAKSTNGMSVSLSPGTRFCDIVVLKHNLVTFSQEAFSCMNEGDVSEKLKQELHVSDYFNATDELINC